MTKEATKFSSFWGDMTVSDGSIIPATPADPKDPPADPPEGLLKEEHEGDGIDDPKDPPDDPKDPLKKDDDEEEEEEDQYEYTEDDVSKAYGILEEEGILTLSEDDEFESTPQGLADAVGATVRNLLKKEIDSIPPVVQEFYAHVQEGGEASSFKPTEARTGWSDLDMEDDANKDVALKAFYMGQGMTSEEALEEIADIPEDKKERKSEIAISTLKKRDENILKAKKAADKKVAEDAAKENADDVKRLRKVVDDTDELAGFKLDTKTKKDAFKDYLFKIKPRTGKTQMQENMSQEDRRMTIAMLDFVNFNKEDFEKEVTTELTKKRKKKLSRYTDKSVSNQRTGSTVKGGDTKKGVKKFPTIFGPSTIEVED